MNELMATAKLIETMPVESIEWRVQRAGNTNGKAWALVVPYADARWLMQRLDEVFGVLDWWDEYEAKKKRYNKNRDRNYERTFGRKESEKEDDVQGSNETGIS